MANSKIQLADGTVLLDLTSDTVRANGLVSGLTAHTASGEAITGTASKVVIQSTTPSDDDATIWIDMSDESVAALLTSTEIESQYVSYDHAQSLTSANQNRALQNLGITDGTTTQKSNLATFAGITLTVVGTI